MKTEASKVEAALRAAGAPMTVDELCKAAFGRVGARERNIVRVNLHRLDERGLIVKTEAKFEIKTSG